MKINILTIIAILTLTTFHSASWAKSGAADQKKAQIILSEWNRHYALVSNLKPDGDIGGYMLYREYSEYDNLILLWKIHTNSESDEVIRFFRKRPMGSGNNDGQVFAVTYHKSQIIVPGEVVLRRFIGTEPTGWSNDTVNFTTGEYLGHQGEVEIQSKLTKEEKSMLKNFNIKIF